MKRKIITIIVCIIIVVLIFVAYNYQNTSSKRPQNYTKLSQIQSIIDKDNDGIDDQIDVLENALAYVDTHPKYKSKYYETGYSDDGYGVCTDVVAFALKNSGYDLQILLEKDIKEYPENYDINQIDSNIDFRRVRNLYVYFKNNTINLTTDVKDYEEWQGGDIVVFKNHIGIVSDRRNSNNVPYVIHHNDCWQKKYEEDILEKRTDIIGHFRISE